MEGGMVLSTGQITHVRLVVKIPSLEGGLIKESAALIMKPYNKGFVS